MAQHASHFIVTTFREAAHSYAAYDESGSKRVWRRIQLRISGQVTGISPKRSYGSGGVGFFFAMGRESGAALPGAVSGGAYRVCRGFLHRLASHRRSLRSCV